MNELIKSGMSTVDSAEVYWVREHKIEVLYRNCQLSRINEDDLSSVAVRVIDGGRIGLSYGTFPDASLIKQAKVAAVHGGKAEFSFANRCSYPAVNTRDDATARIRSDDLVSLCEAIKSIVIKELPGIALNVHCEATKKDLAVATSIGADGEQSSTEFALSVSAPIKGAGTGIGKSREAISPFSVPHDMIEEFIERYRYTEQTSRPRTGRLPAILAPEASFLLTIPLAAGMSGDRIADGTSPLRDRVGEQILSERLSIIDDPTVNGDPLSRSFDDEGVACARRVLVDAGVLRGYLLDLHSGARLNTASTGNGYKRALFGSGTETSPNPWPTHLFIEPGDVPYREMISSMEEGVLLTGGMGFHSGNYPQGEFAVQALGFHIKEGQVLGRLQGTMVAGNIYRDLLRIRAISSEREESDGDCAPYILIDSLQVAG